MTDTGIPGEGQPENAGGQPEAQQQGVPTAAAYPYGPADGSAGVNGAVNPGEEEMLLPGAQGAWGDVQQQDPYAQPGMYGPEAYVQADGYAHAEAYVQTDAYAQAYAQQDPYAQQAAQYAHDPYAQQAAYGQYAQPQEQQPAGAEQFAPPGSPVPGPHETDGRDSGAIDVGAVRASAPEGQETPAAPAPKPGGRKRAASTPPRRPLHLGPPEPEQSGAVRPLSDRGIRNANGAAQPAAPHGSAPVAPQQSGAPQQGAPQPEPTEVTAQPAEPAAPHGQDPAAHGDFAPAQGPETSGPEYFEVAHQDAGSLPGPQLGALPPENGQWAAPEATQDTAHLSGPQLAAPAQESAPVADPSAVAVPDESAQVAPPAPDSGDVAEAAGAHAQPEVQPEAPAQPEAEKPAGPVPAGRGRRRRKARSNTEEPRAVKDKAAESTGNTWVSKPGSTAVEAIAPQGGEGAAPPVTPAGEGEGSTEAAGPAQPEATGQEAPAPQNEPAAQDGAPVQPAGQEPAAVPAEDPAALPEAVDAQAADVPAAPNAAEIPAQQNAQQPAPAAAQDGQPQVPQDEVPADGSQDAAAPGAGSGTDAAAPGADAVAGIPAQQQQDQAPVDALDAPGSEAGVPEAAAMVPRQGQHMDPEADTSAQAAAEEQSGAGSGNAEAEGAPAPVPATAVPPVSEDGPVGVADPEPAEGDETATSPEADASGADPSEKAPAGPPAPGFADDEREAVHRLMRERRDIRNGFRSDPIPHDVLLRVLEAAHTAPSVGHSQPWDFVVIRSEDTRRAMHEMAERQRDAYAKSLPKGRAKQFKELKIEAILDTPVNIVVTADPTRGGRHTLGRHTQPQMAPYSSALAVENLWLAARAEGLGVGWVSFFDEREMVRALELPEHLEVVAYLCVGYVDEFPPEPELAQAGWSKRRPLSWVVHEESYGRRVLPGAEPQDLLSDTVAAIRPLDAKALGEAWERQKRMTKPSGALGMLEIISAQLCGLSRKCPPPLPEPAAVAIFAGDHGVHAQGVTPWPQEVTGQMVANFLGGGAVCNAFANQVGAEVCVIDVGVAGELPATPGLLPRKVRAGTADMTQGPALTREEALRAVEVGIETARDLVAAGNKALLTGEMGIANTTVSAALISVCTGVDAAEVTGRGTGINDETHARKVEVVHRALELHQPDPADPLGLLAAVGGLEHAALVGLILGGASLRTPVILDGVSAGAAALVARCIAPEAMAACIAGHRSSEPGHVAALTKLGLRPLVDLDLRLGEGTGALLSLPMVQSAARAMHEVATFDSAGVTGKA